MKKAIFTLIILFIFSKSFAQVGYSLPLPEKWNSETIAFPIEFAPVIPYKGLEELRFTPGWSNAASNDYWSYMFLWFVDGTPSLSADNLNTYITAYFDGLYRSNDKTKSTGAAGFTKVQFDKLTTSAGDQETYQGKISTLNFLNKQPIDLFVTIHVRNYPDVKQSALFFELSPKPYDNAVWQQLDGIVQGFQLQK